MSRNNRQKRATYSLKRKSGNRGFPKETFLIVCEGEKTEPFYFESFRLTSLKVEVIGTGMNTVSLVQNAIELKKLAKRNKTPFDQVWCVFDKDDFPSENFNSAITLAEKNTIKVAYSNQSFELWYLLHFHFYNTAIDRGSYIDKLSNLLGHKYEKNSKTMYELLVDKQATAIKNADKLLCQYNKETSAERDPSTNVHYLVQELNKYI